MAPPLLPVPIAAAHLSMLFQGPEKTDKDPSWNHVPEIWSHINFKAIDALYLNPFIVEPSGMPEAQYSFGIDHPELRDDKCKGTIVPRLKWIVATARKQNPNIKIFAMQYYGSTALFNLVNDDNSADQDKRMATYARSIPSVLKSYDLDGYDIDYEWNTNEDPRGNTITLIPKLLHQIRAELDKLSKETNGRPYYISISPATSDCLDKTIVNSVSHVNVQTYDGGWRGSADRTLKLYFDLGFPANRVLYGIWPEVTYSIGEAGGVEVTDEPNRGIRYSPPLTEAIKAYDSHKLAGIHSWQINNGECYKFENQVQVVVHNYLHRGKILPNDPTSCDMNTVVANWKKDVTQGGGARNVKT